MITTTYMLQAARSGDRIPMGTIFSASVQTDPVGHPTSCTMGTGSFPGAKSGRGVTLTPQTLLVPWLRKSRAIHLLPLWDVGPLQNLSACTVQLNLYFPYGPYGLYRASVPVQYNYTSTPQWTVQPVQKLSACTVQLYHYSPYGPYSLYRTSVPLQYSYTSTPPMDRTACTEPQCLYSRAIPLLPYGPYGLYRASVPV